MSYIRDMIKISAALTPTQFSMPQTPLEFQEKSTPTLPGDSALQNAPTAPAFSPLYRQIKGLILNSLRLGEWKPGEAIPSEMELSMRFQVSQGTVRKAIDELAADNLLVRRQGKGTFVATHTEQQVQFRFLKLVPDVGTPGSEGPAQRDIIECRRVRATVDIAQALALRAGDAVLQVRRVLSFVGTPTIVEDIWLPATAFKGLTAERLANYKGPTYALFETEFNVRMVRAEEKLRAMPALNGIDQLLKIAPGTPVISAERVAYTYKDIPMELRRGYYRTDTHHYHSTLI